MGAIIVLGASAGGVHALKSIAKALPADLPATVLVVLHVGTSDSVLPELLAAQCALPVRHAVDCERLLPGEILIAPPDRHLTVEVHEGIARARLWHSAKENFTRPAIDPLFRSAAAAFDGKVIGTILTGYLDDGTAGLHAVKTQGGWSVVQDPHDAAVPDMPSSAIRYVEVDHVLPLEHIGPKLAALARYIADTSPGLVPHPPPELPESLAVENRFITGTAGIEDLQRIGKSSCYTCPECHGHLWQLKDQHPPRFRCHTGHSFTLRVLAEQQQRAVEESLWAGLRALQEQANLERDMLLDAQFRQDHAAQRSSHERLALVNADIAALKQVLGKGT